MMTNIDNNTLPIMRLFNTKFWKINNINVNKIIKVVEFIQETLIYIHKKECLVVDFNDLNFLINTFGFSIIYFLDTCAWKTKSFPPMAISPFIRDYSKKDFDELTDFYSFGIIAFQLFVGTHPFKGTHPNYGNTKEDVLKRMKNGASVYDKGVSLNSAVRDFSIIPLNYNQWFKDLFLHGKRTFPPGTAGVVTMIKIDKIISKENLSITLYKEFSDEIIYYKQILGKEIFVFKNSIKINNKKYSNCSKNIVLDNELTPYEVLQKKTMLTLKNLDSGMETETNIKIEDFLIIDNELYCKNADNIFHVTIENGKRLLVLVKNKWSVMKYAFKIFPGIIYENIMGKCWFFIPVYQKNWGVSLNIKELDEYRIIDCERKRNILIVIGKKKNELKKFVVKFNNNYNEYKIIGEKDNIDIISFVVLENGLVINLEDREIEIFDSRFEKDKIKTVKCDIINMIIVNKGNDVMLIEDTKLWRATLK